jgi:hypothetical protein
MGPDRRYLPRAWSPADLLTSPTTGAVPRRGRRSVGVGPGKRSVLGTRRMPHATTSFPSESCTSTPRRSEGQPHRFERDNPTHDGDHHIHRLPVPILAADLVHRERRPPPQRFPRSPAPRDAATPTPDRTVPPTGSPTVSRVARPGATRRVLRPRRWRSLGESGHAAASRDGSDGRARRGAGNCRSIGCSVNRFVNRTLRDSTRRGRRSRQSEMGSVVSIEVTMPVRDCPRRQRPMSYGS